MQMTENYGLKKPESTDKYNIEDFNDNMEILDAKLAECFQRGNEFKENLVSNLIALGFEADTSQSLEELFSMLGTVKQGSGTALPEHVLKPQTFTNADGVEYEGTMEDMSGITIAAASVTQDDSNTYLSVPKAGFYDESSKMYTANSNLVNVVDLGEGTTFDLTSINGYENLTVDDFLISTCTETSKTVSGKNNGELCCDVPAGQAGYSATMTVNIVKEYADGVLTAYVALTYKTNAWSTDEYGHGGSWSGNSGTEQVPVKAYLVKC